MVSESFWGATLNHLRRIRARRFWERQWRTPNFRPPWLADFPRPFVLSGFEQGWLAAGRSVLEIGCGRGNTAAWLAQRGLRVCAIDVSSDVIKQAREIFEQQSNLVFKCADACARMAITEAFDVVIDTGCLQHVPENLRPGYCANLMTWCNPGSRYVVTMHKRDRSADERLAEVMSLFSASFVLVQIEEVPPADTNFFSHLNSVFHFVRRHF